ncbi:hypothetical protein B9G55_04330 [Saccharibacillus sp. O16]|nr:hypothetical protein B9G55_04330 [Saccharibacillus sp. O16]
MMLTIDQFNVVETFSEYGRKAVYRAVDGESGESVILKILRAGAADSHEVSRFKREYRLLKRLNTEIRGVVRPLRLAERGGLLILELEDMGGRSLDRIWAEAEPEYEAFLEAMVGFIDILEEVHLRGVVHKDIKPSNLVWNVRTNEIRLIDFGLSEEPRRDSDSEYALHLPEGSLAYMSPEQTGRINRELDFRTDYYSLGVTLYELASGKRPYPEEHAPEYLYSLLAKNPVPPHEVAPDRVPQALSRVIMKLMGKSPEERYQSAQGIRADLLRCLRGEEEFEPGADDLRERLRIPHRLYGRTSELRRAEEWFHGSVGTQPRLMLVSGEAGTGKTSLVQELLRVVEQENGQFAEGKCDPYNRSMPHAAIIQAFRGLIMRMADELPDIRPAESETAAALRRELAGGGALMCRLIPELESWIGVQPELDLFAPAEDTSRFFLTFAAFVRGLMDGGRPILLFLDDMQRADASEMQLIERLLLDPQICGLAVVWAYRPSEVREGHALPAAVERIGAMRKVTEVELGPLSTEALEALVADALHADVERTRSLTALVRRRTRGNALFVREMLRELHREGLLTYNFRRGSWDWQAEQIAELPVGEDVLELLMQRLSNLNEDTRNLLGVGAVLGAGFDAKLLGLSSGQDAAAVSRCLNEALEEELIVVQSSPEAGNGSESGETALIRFRFRHDRIQQAAYEAQTPDAIGQLHLRIGRALIERSEGSWAGQGKELLQAASHLNAGREWMSAEPDLEQLVILNIEAARVAKSAYGYSTAFDLASAALDLLGASRWERQVERTREALKLYAECAYLCRHLAEADAACAELLQWTDHPLEAAALYEMQVGYYVYLGRMQEALDAGRRGLSLLGIRLPDRASMAAVAVELGRVKLKLATTSIPRIEAGTAMSDSRIKLAMRLLIGMFPAAFISGNQPLFGLIVLKKTALTLKYGLSPESALAFTGYALLLSGMGDVQGAYAFGNLALRINTHFDDLRSRSAVQVLTTLFTRLWQEPWHRLPEAFREGIEAGQRSGELLYLAHACYYINLWQPDMDLNTQLEESGRYIEMIENTGYQEALLTAKLARQQWRALAGLLEDSTSFDGADFSEQECLNQLKSTNYQSGIAIYHLYKMKQLFMSGLYEDAAAQLLQAEAHVGALAGSAFMEEFALYAALICLYAKRPPEALKQRRWQSRLNREIRRLRGWAAQNPANFDWHVRLMRAELARRDGNVKEAGRLYDEACAEAEQHAPVRYKALSFELAAVFQFEKGHSDYGAYLLGKAVYYYAIWGAESKVRQLSLRYPQHASSREEEIPGSGSLSGSSGSIDLGALMLASQAISREIELDHLLQALMEIVIKNAGAQRGCILLRQSPMMVEGRYSVDQDRVTVFVRETSLYDRLPESLLQIAEDTRKTLIYDDASSDPELADDPYVRVHRPRSLVCMPLINQNRTVAVIYLENNLVTGAFNRERMKIINLLSRDMVFSLENATLYEELEQSEAKYRELVDNIQDGIFLIQDGRFVYVNEALAEMLGYRAEEILGARYHTFIHPKDAERVESYYWNRIENREVPSEYEANLIHRDGLRVITAIYKVSGVTYRGKRAVQGTVKDITSRKRSEQELRRHKEHLEELVAERTAELERNNEELNRSLKLIERLSITDELTGLHNRRHFNTVFTGSIARANQLGQSLAYLMLDIDHYKKYNDTYGHFEGDRVLERLGQVLQSFSMEGRSFIFRLGGEEFGILLPGIGVDETLRYAEQVRQGVAALQIEHAGHPEAGIVTVSVGAAWVQGPGASEERLYKMADEALYTSKHTGRNRVTLVGGD